MSGKGKALVILPKFVTKTIAKSAETKRHESKSTQQPAQFFSKQKKWWIVEKTDNGTEELLVTPEVPWYIQIDDLPNENIPMSENKRMQLIDQINSHLEQRYAEEIEAYNRRLANLGGKTDQKWLNSVIQTGTWSDRVAALTLRIQESPFHNLKTLDILIEMASKKDPRVATMALEALRDLLTTNVLPDRLLLSTSQQPLLHSKMNLKQGLIYWYEGELKLRVIKVIQAIELCLQSNVVHFRLQALETTEALLSKKPEQEARMLEMLVNKTGDSDGKVNSKAFEMLNKLLKEHPAMKIVVIKEMRNFIYRPATKITAVFRVVNFLSNLRHRHSETEAVLQLAECYLSLFEKAVNAKEEGSRLLSALLSGINRLFPLLRDVSTLFQYLDPIFKLIHTSPSWSTVTQALTLIANCVMAGATGAASLQQKMDIVDQREQQGSVGSSHTQLAKRYYRALYSTLLTDSAMTNRKEKEYLNLLFKSIKHDPLDNRAMAFVKRIAMCALHATPSLAAALLFLISEILQAKPALKIMINCTDRSLTSLSPATSGDRDDEGSVTTKEQHHDLHMIGCYDAMKREPEFACPEGKVPILHELSLLKDHFHPSVRAFAMALLDPPEHGISYDGDPLEEFSLMSFLNRFAYKNPKEKVMQGLRKKMDEPVNLQFEQLMKKSDGEDAPVMIAPEKHFFYKYFGEREALRAKGKSKRNMLRRRNRGDDDDDDDEDAINEHDGDSDDDVDDDEEAEIDEFADELAEGLMKADAAGRGEFFDEDEDDDDLDMDVDGGDDDEDEGGDEDDEGSFELEAYHSSDDEDLPPPPKASKKGNKKEEATKPKASKKKQVEVEDAEDAEAIDNYLDFEDFRNKKNDKKKTKKSKKAQVQDDSGDEAEGFGDAAMFLDEDDDDIPVHSSKQSKASKQKNKKRKVEEFAGDDDDFADADLYEEQMNENVERYSLKPMTEGAESSLNGHGGVEGNQKRGKRDLKSKQNSKQSRGAFNKRARK